MNFIADSLFSVLLGWTRSLFNDLWNMITNDSSGFTGFLQRFWLPIILILLIGGSLIDYIIWLVRWRPYYIWSARIRQRLQRKQLSRTSHYMEDLDHSPLDLPEYQQFHQEDNQALLDEPVYFDFQPVQASSPQEALVYEQAAHEAPAPDPYVPELPWSNLQTQNMQMPVPQSQDGMFWHEANDQSSHDSAPLLPLEEDLQALQQFPWLDAPAIPMENPAADVAGTPVRRRRAGGKRREQANVLRTLKDTFFTTEDDMDPLDSIQAPIAQEDAFHKPYYPQNYSYRQQAANIQKKEPPES